jgi:REP element-mobilizing transposase RayT
MKPIVIAYHLIWTGYGWWLPNDLRGSSSSVIRSDFISELGNLHHGRKLVQPAGKLINQFYESARHALKYPLLTFDVEMIDCIARAFAKTIEQMKYTCYACAIMPDHVHLVIRKHRDLAEEMIGNLQRESHLLLRHEGFVDLEHPVWGGRGWKVFLDEPDDIWRTIGYVRENPAKIGSPIQAWPFVTAYDSWPLHPGHSPNSPYAKRLSGK